MESRPGAPNWEAANERRLVLALEEALYQTGRLLSQWALLTKQLN